MERIKVLEFTHPDLYRRFQIGYFVVNDRDGAVFSSVSGDMKLEQTQNRFSQGPGGHVIVGKAGDVAAVAEFNILFHEAKSMTNLLHALTNARLMDHLETAIRHNLCGNRGHLFDKNVGRLLDYIRAHRNPFIVLTNAMIPLHNLVTKQVVGDTIKMRYLKVIENGGEEYQKFHTERYIEKSKKLSAKISMVKMPQFDADPERRNKISYEKATAAENVVSIKDIAVAAREIEIATLRGMSSSEVYSYDLLDSTPLFIGDITTKPDKAELVTHLEKYLDQADYQFTKNSPLNTHVMLDFMSVIRQFSTLSIFDNSGGVIKAALRRAYQICPSLEMAHVLFDCYKEQSIKDGERLRRAGKHNPIDLMVMEESVPIKYQIEKFWASSINKENLQKIARMVALRDLDNVVVSGCIVDDEIIQAQGNLDGSPVATELSTLSNNWVEEADCRTIIHVDWALTRGCKRVVIISNDTDTVMILLRYMSHFRQSCLNELWVQYGVSDRRRMIPIHLLHTKLGDDLCRILVKARVLTGDDTLSKVGTKHAAVVKTPIAYLYNFGETENISEAEVSMAEAYLVQVRVGVRSKTTTKTFDQLRYDVHMNAAVPLDKLPPSSSSI